MSSSPHVRSPLPARRFLVYDMVAALLDRGAKGKDGPPQKALTDDAVYEAFDHANTVKRLAAMVNKQPQKDEGYESSRGVGGVRD